MGRRAGRAYGVLCVYKQLVVLTSEADTPYGVLSVNSEMPRRQKSTPASSPIRHRASKALVL